MAEAEQVVIQDGFIGYDEQETIERLKGMYPEGNIHICMMLPGEVHILVFGR